MSSTSLLNPKNIIALVRLYRAAKRLGIDVDDLPAEEYLNAFGPRADPTRWGLVANAEVVNESPVDEPLAAASAAAKEGRWEPAAELVASTWGDWDRRALVVRSLGDLAADDEKWLLQWREARPEDRHHAAVHASSLVAVAWQIRGSDRANNTAREQFAGFHRVLGEAEVAAAFAAELLPDDPTPWVTTITVARGLQYDNERFEQVWQELVARAPHHRSGHTQALQYWCAKWFGSHEKMLDFATRAAATSPALAFLPMEAAVELELDGEDTGVWTSPAVRGALEILLTRLAGVGTGSTALLNDRSYAAVALAKNNRHDEALEQLRVLGRHWGQAPWSYHSDERLGFLQFRNGVCRKARKPKR